MENNGPRRHHHHHHHHHRNSSGKGGRHSRNELDVARATQLDEGDDIPEAFVEFNSTPNEVKRATIVGNPMFSDEESVVEQKTREDLLALEELNLGMDYQQMMEYFDNLKESNA